MPKYVVPGIPQGAQLSAFMPNWTRLAQSGAVQYKQAVSGSPGTTGVPAPAPAIAASSGRSAQAMMGTSRSSDAPDVWYPQEYYQTRLTERPGAGMPIRVYSDNLLPVPARDARGKSAVLSRPVLQRGRVQIAAPRVVPSWGPGG